MRQLIHGRCEKNFRREHDSQGIAIYSGNLLAVRMDLGGATRLCARLPKISIADSCLKSTIAVVESMSGVTRWAQSPRASHESRSDGIIVERSIYSIDV